MASGIGPSLHKAAQDNVELQPAPNQLLKREPTREEVCAFLHLLARAALLTATYIRIALSWRTCQWYVAGDKSRRPSQLHTTACNPLNNSQQYRSQLAVTNQPHTVKNRGVIRFFWLSRNALYTAVQGIIIIIML